jgi:hypothetical protein
MSGNSYIEDNMALTEEQKNAVAGWVESGSSLSDIQRSISREFGVAMTYMDVRFLVDDLGAVLADKEVPRQLTPDVSMNAEPAPAGIGSDGAFDLDDNARASSLNVEVDRITKPGSVVSGSVTFSDGVAATWMVDGAGRLALSASTPGYKPSQEDLEAFQLELGQQLQKKGF